jgi:hypothetical protein
VIFGNFARLWARLWLDQQPAKSESSISTRINLAMPFELKMPALSPTMEEGKLSKWLVKVGDNYGV